VKSPALYCRLESFKLYGGWREYPTVLLSRSILAQTPSDLRCRVPGGLVRQSPSVEVAKDAGEFLNTFSSLGSTDESSLGHAKLAK
jgi:hypothetical protein